MVISGNFKQRIGEYFSEYFNYLRLSAIGSLLVGLGLLEIGHIEWLSRIFIGLSVFLFDVGVLELIQCNKIVGPKIPLVYEMVSANI